MGQARRWAIVALVAAIGGCGARAPGDTGEDVGESAAAITTFPNDQAAYAFFLGKGLTGAQAAGIVGNLDVESGDDPTSVESGGGGRGLAQWLAGGRWDTTSGDNVASYAEQQGEEALSLHLQLEFIWFELTTFPDYGLAALRATTSVSGAVSAFSEHYEGCSTCDSSARVADGENVLATFGGAPTPVTTEDAATAAPSCTLESGAVGSCLETSSCAALGNHVSTAGRCPGAANIQCCTAASTGTEATDAGAPASSAVSSGGCALGAGPADASWLASLVALARIRRRRRRRSTSSPPTPRSTETAERCEPCSREA